MKKRWLKGVNFADLAVLAFLLWSFFKGDNNTLTVYLLSFIAGYAFGHGFSAGWPGIKISLSKERETE